MPGKQRFRDEPRDAGYELMELEFMGLHSGTSKHLEDRRQWLHKQTPPPLPVQNNGSDESVPYLCRLDSHGDDCSDSELPVEEKLKKQCEVQRRTLVERLTSFYH